MADCTPAGALLASFAFWSDTAIATYGMLLLSLASVLGFGPLLPSRRAAALRAKCTVGCTAASDGTRPAPPLSGGPIVRGTEDLMRPKAHGSTATPVQATLRWGVDRAVADFICSRNRDGAEPSLAFARCQPLTEELSSAEPVTLILTLTLTLALALTLTLTTLALTLALTPTLTLTRSSSMTASAGRPSSWRRRAAPLTSLWTRASGTAGYPSDR